MDPLADKLMTIMALFCFYVSGLRTGCFGHRHPSRNWRWWWVAACCWTHQIVVYSKMCGKVAACLFLPGHRDDVFPAGLPWNTMLYAALALMVYSFFFYLR